jgi:chromosome segregation ATPase
MNEIKKTIQDMREEINKDMEILKNNQSEISSICQINITIECLLNRVEQVENRESGTEDKVEELDQTVKDHERMLRKYKWNMQGVRDTMKRTNLRIMGVEEGAELQTKGTDNLFNRIKQRTSLTSRNRESLRCRKLTDHQTTRTKRETPPGP